MSLFDIQSFHWDFFNEASNACCHFLWHHTYMSCFIYMLYRLLSICLPVETVALDLTCRDTELLILPHLETTSADAILVKWWRKWCSGWGILESLWCIWLLTAQHSSGLLSPSALRLPEEEDEPQVCRQTDSPNSALLFSTLKDSCMAAVSVFLSAAVSSPPSGRQSNKPSGTPAALRWHRQ